MRNGPFSYPSSHLILHLPLLTLLQLLSLPVPAFRFLPVLPLSYLPFLYPSIEIHPCGLGSATSELLSVSVQSQNAKRFWCTVSTHEHVIPGHKIEKQKSC